MDTHVRAFVSEMLMLITYNNFHMLSQSELPRPIPRNSEESDDGCTSRIYFDNAGDNVTLTSIPY